MIERKHTHRHHRLKGSAQHRDPRIPISRYPRAICRGYHFWNQAVNTPSSAGRMELIAPTRLAASVCMMRYVQTGVIRYSTPHAAVRMRFVLMNIGLRNAASPL